MKHLSTGDGFILRMEYEVDEGTILPTVAFVIKFKDQMGVELFRLSNTPISGFHISNVSGRGAVDLVIPVLPLVAGVYYMDISVARPSMGVYKEYPLLVSLSVARRDVYGSGLQIDRARGIITLVHKWVHRANGNCIDSGWRGMGVLARKVETQTGASGGLGADGESGLEC